LISITTSVSSVTKRLIEPLASAGTMAALARMEPSGELSVATAAVALSARPSDNRAEHSRPGDHGDVDGVCSRDGHGTRGEWNRHVACPTCRNKWPAKRSRTACVHNAA